jgi:transposase
MERIPKGIYTPEFRAEAVRLVQTTGVSVAKAAKQLAIPKSSLDNWVRAAKAGKVAQVGKGQRLPSELELELARTRKELAEVKMERDLLKKFATYFAKESR